MVDLLSTHTGMRVLPAENNQRVEPNHVYVIPPGTALLIEHGALRLTEPREHHGARMPIDAFFHSLATERREKAIGIVLSGTGTDGTQGLKAIRQVGGLVLVQDPDEAAYDGMPVSVIASGAVDHVMPVKDMPAALIGYVAQPHYKDDYRNRLPGDSARDILPDVVAALTKRTLINFNLYKEGTLLRRIQRRMGIAHSGDGKAYLDLLKKEPEELDRLHKDLMINVTCFFRDAAMIDCLTTQVLPALVREQSGDRAFRVWVAGCASGEEAYSIAMLLIEQAEALGRRLKIQIFATDLDAEALAAGRYGIYPESIEADVSADRLKRFFVKQDHAYHVIPELRETVVFAEHNLLSDAPFSRLDMVSCRNVLIYLDSKAQGAIIEMFHFALKKDGILVLGTSETLPDEDGRLEVVSREYHIYRRCGGRRRVEHTVAPILSSRTSVGFVPVRKPMSLRLAGDVSRLTQRLLLEQYAPAAVLTNRRYAALYFSGPIDRYIRVPVGEAGQDVLAMVR